MDQSGTILVIGFIIISFLLIFIATRRKKPYRASASIRFSYGGQMIMAHIRKIDKQGAGIYHITADASPYLQQRKPYNRPQEKLSAQPIISNQKARPSPKPGGERLHPLNNKRPGVSRIKPLAPQPGIRVNYPQNRFPRHPKLRRY